MSQKVLILGGDGFCGWPTALHLSQRGWDVTIVDNLSRRKIDVELECESLTPIHPIHARLAAWKKVSGKDIEFHLLDIAEDYDRLLELIRTVEPDAIVHFAEQRSAPYSMKSSASKRYTVGNNINATNNVLCAIVESGKDIHVVHLGTMGVYGYGSAGFKIPEGYITVRVEGEGEAMGVRQQIMYPPDPGSIYHMTKTQDALLFYYYNKNDKIRVTDLHQGVVWGTNTEETMMDEVLINRFDYDGDYGTVLNRFLMQAAVGHPLTVHGSGGQTRAFIHIRDSVRCVELALETPPEKGERVRIFNQMTETHTVLELANKVSGLAGGELSFLPNPRNEAANNSLHVENACLLELGLKPTKLADPLLEREVELAKRFAQRCDRSKILCTSLWHRQDAVKKSPSPSDAPLSSRVS